MTRPGMVSLTHKAGTPSGTRPAAQRGRAARRSGAIKRGTTRESRHCPTHLFSLANILPGRQPRGRGGSECDRAELKLALFRRQRSGVRLCLRRDAGPLPAVLRSLQCQERATAADGPVIPPDQERVRFNARSPKVQVERKVCSSPPWAGPLSRHLREAFGFGRVEQGAAIMSGHEQRRNYGPRISVIATDPAAVVDNLGTMPQTQVHKPSLVQMRLERGKADLIVAVYLLHHCF